jgi:hypothetical protein
MFRRATALLLLVFLCSLPLFAALTGDLEGTVRDQSGAVVADAQITVRSANGATRTVTTNADGHFAVQQLELGDYEVKIEKAGFRSSALTAQVRSGEKTRIDAGLQVGSPTEVVNVEGGTVPLLDVATSQISQSIDSKEVVDLPLQTRDPVQLATLSAGVVPVTKDNPFLGSGSFNSNGSRGRGNNITVDGVTATDISTTGSSGTGTFSLDSVQEVKLISNNFNAEFGRNSGAQVQIITKGGSNEFHGTAYWFHQNGSVFNARDHFDDTGEPTALIRNQWGATFGGPIFKNKTFFYGQYEGLKIRGSGATAIASVLTPAEAAAITDPTSKALFAAVGAPTSPTGQLNSAAPNASDQYTWRLRIDQNFNAGKDSFNASYGENPQTTVSPGLTFITGNLTNFGASNTSTARQVTFAETHIFSPTIVNLFRFNFGRNNPDFPINTTTAAPYTPQITVSGKDTFGLWSGLGQGRIQNTFQWSDSLSWSMGRHQLKTGGDLYYYQANSFFDSNLRGTLTFGSLSDFQNGIPASYTQRFGNSSRHNVAKDFAWFGQDDIRVTQALTLNLGLRLERAGAVKEKDEILANINTGRQCSLGGGGTGAMGCVDLGGVAFRSNLNYAPRLGFAYSTMHDKMVVRGGYGWAYDYIFLNPITNLRFSPPFMPSISVVSGSFTGGNTYAALLNGTATSQAGAKAAIGSFPSTQVNFGAFSPVQQDLRNPRNQQWNFGVQYELFKDSVLKVGYVGARSSYLQASVPLNIANQNRPAPATSEADEIARRLTQFRPFNTTLSGNSSTPATGRVDPRFNGVTQVQSAADSNFHSMQVDFTTRTWRNLTLNANYTWGHSIDDASDVLGVLVNDTAGYQDPLNISNNRANSEFDIRHRVVGRFVYSLPFGKSYSGVAGKLTRGWNISGSTDWHSGLPVTILAGTRRGITDNVLLGGLTAVVRASGDVSQLNVGAGTPGGFATPAAALCARGVVSGANDTSCPNTLNFPVVQPFLGNLGNTPRNGLRLSGFFNADASVWKDTPITEHLKMQFRWEFYNIFNHTNLSGYVNQLTTPQAVDGTGGFNTYQSTATDMRQMQAAIRFVF